VKATKIILLVLILFLISCVTWYLLFYIDAAGNRFDLNWYKPDVEKKICQECNSYQGQPGDKDCAKIVGENGGSRHSILFLSEKKHTYKQCQKALER